MSESALPRQVLSLKEQKEAFVTGHDGTSPWELLLVCLSAPIGLWLYQLVLPSRSSATTRVLLEAMLILLPMILMQTNLIYSYGIDVLALETIVESWLWWRREVSLDSSTTQESTTTTKRQAEKASPKKYLEFLTCYRSFVLCLTFVAILAVDFKVFPRRFAKTEVTGYGLMDLGAGSFVVVAGLVSPRARNKETKQPMFVWKRIVPLICMGMIRLVTNKAVEYQEHVSEYGVHWNFFFTIAVMAPLASLLSLPTNWQSHNWILAALLMGCYQMALSNFGLQEYVEDGPRSCQGTDWLCNAFAANREGMLGCLGYTSLYVWSEEVARRCLWTCTDNVQRGRRVVVWSATLWILHAILVHLFGIPVSRRTTNVSFCIWTLAHNMTILTLLCFVMESNPTSTTPPILNAVNNHGLVVFVVANLLTGLVNLSVNTLEATDAMALAILFVYLCAVGGFALLADFLIMPLLGRTFRGKPRKKTE